MDELGRFSGQLTKYCLRDILCSMPIAVYLPQRSGVDEVHMAAHELREGRVRAFGDILTEQIRIITHDFLHNKIPAI